MNKQTASMILHMVMETYGPHIAKKVKNKIKNCKTMEEADIIITIEMFAYYKKRLKGILAALNRPAKEAALSQL